MSFKQIKFGAWNIEITGTRGEVYVSQIHAAPVTLPGGVRAEFVARFKYARPMVNANAFVKFLCNNFTPAEYFAQRAAGIPPLTILRSKGYKSPNERAYEVAQAQYAAEVSA
jgi:hypothetical protein